MHQGPVQAHIGHVWQSAVQNLVGTLACGTSELGLFVTVATFSAAALELERARQNFKLLTGNGVVTLVLDNNLKLARTWGAGKNAVTSPKPRGPC